MHFNTHYRRCKGMLGVCVVIVDLFNRSFISNRHQSLPQITGLQTWCDHFRRSFAAGYMIVYALSLLSGLVFSNCLLVHFTFRLNIAVLHVHTYNFCLCSPAHTNALSIQLKAAQSIIMTSAWQLLLLLPLVLLLSYVQLGEACLQWCFLPTMRLNVTGQWSSAWWYSCWGRARGRVIRHDSYALVYAAAKFPAKVVVWLCGCKLQNNKITI